jgi:serine/threonine protein kinase
MTGFLNEQLNRYAMEFAAQYKPIPEDSSASNELITRSAWEECAARTGVLGDGSRLQSVQAFLSEARQQSHREGPNLDGLTQAGAVMGSPNYMAPEQARGDLARIGPRTDVYALGGVLYELLTGQPPFRSATVYDLLSQACSAPPTPPTQMVPGLATEIEAVCLKCLEKSPDNRYTTAQALADDLTRFLSGERPEAARWNWWPFRRTAPATPSQTDDSTTTKSWWPFGRRQSKAGDSKG